MALRGLLAALLLVSCGVECRSGLETRQCSIRPPGRNAGGKEAGDDAGEGEDISSAAAPATTTRSPGEGCIPRQLPWRLRGFNAREWAGGGGAFVLRGGGEDHGHDVVMDVDVPGAVGAASASASAAAAAAPDAAGKGGEQVEGIGSGEGERERERERDVGLLLERMREKREDVEKNAEMRVNPIPYALCPIPYSRGCGEEC
jgi:hypothetical protein